jgi:hypothetical protein
MGVYTLLFVSCGHCKAVAWQFMPLAPGLVVWELTRSLLRLPHLGNAVGMSVSGAVTLLMLFGMAALLRRGGRWRMALWATAALVSAVGAVMLLALIRA